MLEGKGSPTSSMASLYQELELYRSILDNSNQAELVINAETTKIVLANNLFSKITGYPLKDIVGTDLFSYLDGKSKESLKQVYPEIIIGKRKNFIEELEIVAVNGRTISVEGYFSVNEFFRYPVYICAYLTDISEKKRIENELRKTNRFLRKVIESSVDGIIATDIKGNILIFNEGAEKMLDYRVEDVIGKIHIEQLYPRGEAREIMKMLRNPQYGGMGKLETSQSHLINSRGELVPINISATIIYDEDGKEIASVGIFTDLREKIKMERQLQDTQLQLMQSEKMASLGKLAAGVAHEINNPLGGILIFSNLILESQDPGSQTYTDSLKVVEEATRCKEIVKDLLEFAHQTSPDLAPLDVNKALEQSIMFLSKQSIFHNIKIMKELEAELPPILGNISQLNQVFINILVNAAEAMDGSGVISIKSKFEKKRGLVSLSLTDTGPGISEEILSRIFDPFFSTKEVGEGTGLGLSISYGIIEAHRGRIYVKSRLGEGTTFFIEFPLYKNHTQAGLSS